MGVYVRNRSDLQPVHWPQMGVIYLNKWHLLSGTSKCTVSDLQPVYWLTTNSLRLHLDKFGLWMSNLLDSFYNGFGLRGSHFDFDFDFGYFGRFKSVLYGVI